MEPNRRFGGFGTTFSSRCVRPLIFVVVLCGAVCCASAQESGYATTPAKQAPVSAAAFEPFLTAFKQAILANHAPKIASFLHFPFYVYSSSYSRSEFLRDRREKVNFFTVYVRGQILKSKVEDFMTYADKSESQMSDPGLKHIPQNSPVVELDIINPHGGPAMRLIFAVQGSTYKLFCLMQ